MSLEFIKVAAITGLFSAICEAIYQKKGASTLGAGITDLIPKLQNTAKVARSISHLVEIQMFFNRITNVVTQKQDLICKILMRLNIFLFSSKSRLSEIISGWYEVNS